MGQETITTWMHRLTRLARGGSIASIAVPDRLPRATSLGIMAGITDMTRLNRLTKMARMPRIPILGKLVKR